MLAQGDRVYTAPFPTFYNNLLLDYNDLDDACSRDKAYWAIIITILPLWAIVTTLIVFVLLAFHKNLRSTKIYDNCTKNTAQYPYYVEIRTGDTSSTYNRRRTTLTIDMFDDNQTTLARVAVPGHVLFGKKDAAIGPIDDEKYFELRVTRFWLYRSIKLRRISTIRLTHSCLEPEARIMIYGVELRSNEPDQHKLFFPIMNYISAYGSTAKPNACFDLETAGSITAMGGSQIDSTTITKQLSWTDYTLLSYLLIAIIYVSTTFDVVPDGSKDSAQSAYRGAIVGLVAYFIVLVIGVILKQIIKYYYALDIGTGIWALVYYLTCTLLLIVSTGLWIFTTIKSYKNLCPEVYTKWVLSISIALIEAICFSMITYLIYWLINVLNPKYTEQYLVPEEWVSNQEPPSKGQNINQFRTQYVGSVRSGSGGNLPASPMQWTGHNPMPMHYVVPSTGYNHPNTMYGPPYIVNTPIMATSPAPYKTVQTSYEPPHPPPNQSFNNYSNQVNLHGIKPSGPKRIGSNESTGSTYYQQLMKNKGGVKSISQYGELLKQKKAGKHGGK